MVVFAVPSSSCGRTLTGLDTEGADLVPAWDFPDECVSDRRPLTIVAAVDRATLLDAERLVLRAEPPFFTRDAVAEIDIDSPLDGG